MSTASPTSASGPATGPVTGPATESACPAWAEVCAVSAMVPGRGVCALVGGRQVAVFLVDGEVFALDNRDPFSGANVLSRGIVGSAGDRLKVASPVYKQCFDLRTGECLDDPTVAVGAHPARVRDGRIEVSVSGRPGW